ncbi:hypothetical protein SAMN05216503_1525 [Polaribacter sp. KT25b]|uniref:hypothetical protein n=1 Tax=Polaribacter sp. KT25b TaxID=1855336 RepID=UPI000879B9BB|nr:hypothetical protein [Polaribacter sp. KT25b]SDR96119.1 hypothetical protein SAMN05216503_1525 [Polaribacter sp. KT25b]
MKKVIVLLVLTTSLFSCNSLSIFEPTSLNEATSLLKSLNSDSTLQEVTSIFNLLDINRDSSISTTEAIGLVEENFSILDADKSESLNIKELHGLVKLVK